jgi:hypothetical protein
MEYIRRRNVILYADGKSVYESFPSVSQAKRRSRLLQGTGNFRGAAVPKDGNRVTVDRSADPKPNWNPYAGRRSDPADRFLREAMRAQQAERVAQEQAARKPSTLTLSGPLGKLVDSEVKRMKGRKK